MKCEVCNYDLAGLHAQVARCPECGAKVYWGTLPRGMQRGKRYWQLSFVPSVPFLLLSVAADLSTKYAGRHGPLFEVLVTLWFLAVALAFLAPLPAFVWLVASQRRTKASDVMYGLGVLFACWLAIGILLVIAGVGCAGFVP